MNNRIFAFTLAVLLMGGLASADVVVTKKGRIHGLGSKSKDGTAITVDNWPRFIEESKGDIVYLGYRGLSFQRGRKPSVIAWSDIEDFEFNEADPDWEDGNKHYSIGDWSSALGAYRDCAASAEARPVFKVESEFYICVCLLQQGNKKAALRQLRGWKHIDSRHTPAVYRILAEIATVDKKFSSARSHYAKIEALPELPEASVLSAKLGLVKVEIAENKFGEAEAALGRIKARNTRAKDANTTAGIAVLRARIVIKSNAVDRFEEVRRELEKVAEDLKGVDDPNRAAVYAALGDILFKQGKSDEARFPYMRVVCMYPSESGQVANCLLNAGQCFINLATAQKETDKAKYKQYLDEGMKLLRECAGKYKNPGARKAYRRYKAEWEALKVPDTKGG